MYRTILLICLMAIATGASAAEPWRRAVSRHFIVYSAQPLPDLIRFTNRLERYDEILRARIGLPDDDGVTPLTVFLVRDQRAVAQAAGSSGDGLLGFYSPRIDGAVAVSAAKGWEERSMFGIKGEPILFHEYTHHLMLHYFPEVYSRWYVEGLAELYSTLEFGDDDQVMIGKPNLGRMPLLRMSKYLLTLDRMVTSRPDDFSDAYYATLYSKGWLLTHYLNFNPRYAARLPAYVRALNAGKSDKVAMESAFGVTLGTLDRELRDYFLAGRMPFIPVHVPRRARQPRIEEVSPAMQAVMEDVMLFDPALADYQVSRLAGRMRKTGAAYPRDLFVQQMLAEVELAAKRPAEAVQAAEQALLIAPDDSRALLVIGRAKMAQLMEAKSKDASAWAEARRWITRANRADPDSAAALLAFHESYTESGQKPPPIASQGLVRAVEIAPQSDKLRLALAIDRARTGDIAGAITAIRPVATRPHRSDDVKLAIALLSAWEKQAAPALPGRG